MNFFIKMLMKNINYFNSFLSLLIHKKYKLYTMSIFHVFAFFLTDIFEA